jgi:hypothetical protein
MVQRRLSVVIVDCQVLIKLSQRPQTARSRHPEARDLPLTSATLVRKLALGALMDVAC